MNWRHEFEAIFIQFAFLAMRRLRVFRDSSWDRVKTLSYSYTNRRVIAQTERVRQGVYLLHIWWHSDVASLLATLLHEMAHVSAWHTRAGHGRRWMRTFAAAVTEFTGISVDARSLVELDVAAEEAMASVRVRVALYVVAAIAVLVQRRTNKALLRLWREILSHLKVVRS